MFATHTVANFAHVSALRDACDFPANRGERRDESRISDAALLHAGFRSLVALWSWG